MTTQSKSKNSNIELLQRAYNADQQVKYIHLEAEIDLLLHQIQALQNKVK
ncbi:hypothetical protein Cyast_2306 [Cyanobacterium stanieri PCC 7202]|uniref:Uncharacterized protein n=1 Tax=Cyanobacterium stanieri (strain ATCC 29140 / PCC 7202) TaxID=292563 RepID=K9YN18_CYASC|nr:hypothetical protein Cyast_2306 [Cyanobacterium stanieri PCC 7202]